MLLQFFYTLNNVYFSKRDILHFMTQNTSPGKLPIRGSD